jgi:hypothetical protein
MARSFQEHNRLTRDWINWADIAESCAHDGQPDIHPSSKTRITAYAELVKALVAGEFDDASGNTRVHFLCSRVRLRWMSRQELDLLSDFPVEQRISAYFQYFWIRNRMAVEWFERRQRPVPGWLARAKEEPPARPSFDRAHATGILLGMKHSKELPHRPSAEMAIEILTRHYDGVPHDPVRALVTEVWGPGKRGSRNSRLAKSAK